MITFWPPRSMWNVNVFEPPMLIDVAVWFGATLERAVAVADAARDVDGLARTCC